MGRWRLGRAASRLWSWRSSSPIPSQAFTSIADEGSQWRTRPCIGSKLSRAWMATKAGGGSKGAIDDFEKYVLGKGGGDEEEPEFHEFGDDSGAAAEQQASGGHAEEDDFLQELTRIERGGDRKDKGDGLMLQRGYDEDNVPFDDEIDPENHESMLEQEDAVFWSEELRKFVTPKGLLNLPGMGRDDYTKPYQLRPERVYFPGQTIEPEDFDVTRIASSDPTEMPPRAKKVMKKSEVLAAADFRNVKFLSLFLSETSRIIPRKTTRVSQKSQRRIAREIKTARSLGLLPYSSMGDPPFRYLKNEPAKDVDPEDAYDEFEDEAGQSGGGPRFRRRLF